MAGGTGVIEPRAGSFEVYVDWTGPGGTNHTGEPPPPHAVMRAARTADRECAAAGDGWGAWGMALVPRAARPS